MKKDKDKLIDLLVKRKEDPHITYAYIERMSGYTKMSIIRMNRLLETKDIEEIKTHGNAGRKPSITASETEIEYIKRFKLQYPKITIAQFKDIYDEDIIDNPKMKKDVVNYGLKKRSVSFFRELYIRFNWKSPVKHRKNNTNGIVHHLRQAMPRKGMLIQIDGTPFDWFNNGEMYSLHLAVDDATKEIIAGWFTKNECLYGYLKVIEIMIREYGVPIAMYSDKHSIFNPKDKIEGQTKFQTIMERLGVETIRANSSEAKGRIERYNGTCQNRLPNDIRRFGIKDYDELNIWFNSFYKHYLNRKFANIALDPIDEFVPVEEDFDYVENLSIQVERIINNDMFSYEECLFSPIDVGTGEIKHITNGIKINVLHDIINKKLYVKRYGQLLPCIFIKETHKKNEINNRKELSSRIRDFIDR